MLLEGVGRGVCWEREGEVEEADVLEKESSRKGRREEHCWKVEEMENIEKRRGGVLKEVGEESWNREKRMLRER